LRLLEHQQPGHVNADEYSVKHTAPNASQKSLSMPPIALIVTADDALAD